MDMPMGPKPAEKTEPSLSQILTSVKIVGAVMSVLWAVGMFLYHDAVQPVYHYTTGVNTDIHDLKIDVKAVKSDVGLLKSDATTIKETQQKAQEHFQRTDDHFERIDALMTERREGDVYRTRLAEQTLRFGKSAAKTAAVVKTTLERHEGLK